MTNEPNTTELRGRYLVIGPPGTGKTTFLSGRVKQITDDSYGKTPPGTSPVVISSLTRAAAAVIAGKVERLPNGAVATLHAHGVRSQDMPTVLSASMIDEWNRAQPAWALTRDKFGSSRGDTDPGPDAEGLKGDKPGDLIAEAYHLLRHRMTPRDEWPKDVQLFAELFENFKRDNEAIDYTDMIALASDMPPLSPEVLILDEVQDFSALEWALVAKWEKHCRAMIAVGDPYQALYSWRGAHPQYLTDKRIPANHRGVLRQSYRVPLRVQQAANKWISQLSDYEPVHWAAKPGDPGDVCRTGDGDSLTRCSRVIDMAAELAAKGKTVMIQGTCNYMLDPVVDELRSRGLPFGNPYRRHAGWWNPLARRRNALMAPDRLLAFLAPVLDYGPVAAREWAWCDLAAWVDPLTAEGTLVHGAKTHISDMAKQRPDATPTAVEVADLFEPGGYSQLTQWLDARAMDPQRVPLDDGVRWWERRLSPSKAKSSAYTAEVVTRHGVKAIIDEPRIMVGTMHCSPADEIVTTTFGGVPIGDLNPRLHRLVSFRPGNNAVSRGKNSRAGYGQGYEFEIGSRPYDGPLVVVETNRSKTRVTPEHRMRVRFGETFYGKWIVYLMRRGNWWRVGLASTARIKPYVSGGLKGRMATEQADAGWIVGVYTTKHDAIMAETYTQAKYGLPSFRFESTGAACVLTTKQLQSLHTRAAEFSGINAARLLRDLGMFIDAPLYSRDGAGTVEKRHGYWFETIAANLIDGYMEVPTFCESDFARNTHTPIPMIARVRRESYSGLVYSMKVDPHEHYISGNAVVHNSFKGGECDVAFVAPDISNAAGLAWCGHLDESKIVNETIAEKRDSVIRTLYVGMTRCREALVLLGPSPRSYSVNWMEQ